ncbi:hypothetical protein FOZ62_007106 [Perkinsus olseni]|uniref:Uncharacterized protein n=1 Tax=Perkinsus olseni TaxID=32597 RepID=A0A7J6TRP8_PEROL|nr:hypothetical protein FOZ62_007106 [Perkinsus olseni]
MTIICREPALLMLLVIPSLEAMHSIKEDLKASDVKKQTVDFSDLKPSAAKTEISHVVEKQDGSLCVFDWYVSTEHEEAGLWITKREDVRVMARLDPEQKAFTFMKAFSHKGHGWRDIIVKDDKDELVVEAYEHSEDLGTVVYPEIKAGPVGTDKRNHIEKVLLKEGPFSPLGHLKGDVLNPLIESIDWQSDNDQLKCEKIYHFAALNAPDGYKSGNLDWLFHFVHENTERIEKQVRKLEQEGAKKPDTGNQARKMGDDFFTTEQIREMMLRLEKEGNAPDAPRGDDEERARALKKLAKTDEGKKFGSVRKFFRKTFGRSK